MIEYVEFGQSIPPSPDFKWILVVDSYRKFDNGNKLIYLGVSQNLEEKLRAMEEGFVQNIYP